MWRLTVEGTVEEKLLAMQARKSDLAHAALEEPGAGDDDGDAGEEGGDAPGAGRQKLTVPEHTDFFR